jgi:hypothetical protein
MPLQPTLSVDEQRALEISAENLRTESGLEDTHRAGRTDAVAVKEDHDFAHDLLLGPGGGNAASPHGTDPIHLVKATGFGFDHSPAAITPLRHSRPRPVWCPRLDRQMGAAALSLGL